MVGSRANAVARRGSGGKRRNKPTGRSQWQRDVAVAIMRLLAELGAGCHSGRCGHPDWPSSAKILTRPLPGPCRLSRVGLHLLSSYLRPFSSPFPVLLCVGRNRFLFTEPPSGSISCIFAVLLKINPQSSSTWRPDYHSSGSQGNIRCLLPGFPTALAACPWAAAGASHRPPSRCAVGAG